jgi:hypothetical protein
VTISEHLILDDVRAEADRLMAPDDVELSGDDAGQRNELEARRLRIVDLFEAGHIDRAERERRLAALQEQLERLDARRVVAAIPTAIDWSWPPRELNAVLRALFEEIELDPDTFRPVAFRWHVPEWRAQ